MDELLETRYAAFRGPGRTGGSHFLGAVCAGGHRERAWFRSNCVEVNKDEFSLSRAR